MAFTARDDWKDGDKYPAARMVELEAAVAAPVAYEDVTGKPTIPAAPTADTLSGATAVGKSVIKAEDAAAARAAIGAGTSNLKIGTGAGDALAGNTTIPAATAAGTRAQLDAGTDTTVRAFSAKDVKEFVDARIAALAEPKAG